MELKNVAVKALHEYGLSSADETMDINISFNGLCFYLFVKELNIGITICNENSQFDKLYENLDSNEIKKY